MTFKQSPRTTITLKTAVNSEDHALISAIADRTLAHLPRSACRPDKLTLLMDLGAAHNCFLPRFAK